MSQKDRMRNKVCPCGSGKKFKNCHGGGVLRSNAPATLISGLAIISAVVFIAYLTISDRPTGRAANSTVTPTQYASIPGLEIAQLPEYKEHQLVTHLNHTPCICDCKMTVAECRNIDPECKHSAELVAAYLDDLGYPTQPAPVPAH